MQILLASRASARCSSRSLSRSSLSRVQDAAAAGTLPADSAPCPLHTLTRCHGRLFDLCSWLFDLLSPDSIVGQKQKYTISNFKATILIGFFVIQEIRISSNITTAVHGWRLDLG